MRKNLKSMQFFGILYCFYKSQSNCIKRINLFSGPIQFWRKETQKGSQCSEKLGKSGLRYWINQSQWRWVGVCEEWHVKIYYNQPLLKWNFFYNHVHFRPLQRVWEVFPLSDVTVPSAFQPGKGWSKSLSTLNNVGGLWKRVCISQYPVLVVSHCI